METVVLRLLFIVGLSVSGTQIGKHVYVPLRLTWGEAQQYCRAHFTDLTPITDENRMKNATIAKVDGDFWIGLYFDNTDWWWSGGTRATRIPWGTNQPDFTHVQKAGAICWSNCYLYGWYNTRMNDQLQFLCINLMVKTSTATWEQALQQCREKHTDLTSLTSETEQLLALREIQHDDITERVWIGLRYLGDRWLWMNNDTLRYKAWRQGGDQDHLCPTERRCGALTKQGVWENWDCQDRLNFICY